MPVGIQIWNPDGSLEVDLTSRLLRFIDTIVINGDGVAGSRSYSLSAGEEIVVVPAYRMDAYTFPPRFTVNGGNVSWDYHSPLTTATRYATGSIFIMIR